VYQWLYKACGQIIRGTTFINSDGVCNFIIQAVIDHLCVVVVVMVHNSRLSLSMDFSSKKYLTVQDDNYHNKSKTRYLHQQFGIKGGDADIIEVRSSGGGRRSSLLMIS